MDEGAHENVAIINNSCSKNVKTIMTNGNGNNAKRSIWKKTPIPRNISSILDPRYSCRSPREPPVRLLLAPFYESLDWINEREGLGLCLKIMVVEIPSRVGYFSENISANLMGNFSLQNTKGFSPPKL